MTISPKKSKNYFAKIMAAACVRRGEFEQFHAGISPVTRTGDYSDVKVIDAEGREIPWNQVSRINQDEMKTLMTNDYNQFVDYHDSSAGFVLDFLTGYSSAQQGDYLSPALDIMNQDADLTSAKNSEHFWAWVSILTTVGVFYTTRKNPQK